MQGGRRVSAHAERFFEQPPTVGKEDKERTKKNGRTTANRDAAFSGSLVIGKKEHEKVTSKNVSATDRPHKKKRRGKKTR